MPGCSSCCLQTLLDGEMVVDEDLEGNKMRRFLIYDLVAINGVSLCQRPWKVGGSLGRDGGRAVGRGKESAGAGRLSLATSPSPFGACLEECLIALWLLAGNATAGVGLPCIEHRVTFIT
jgi:hypothetical protein